MSIEISPQLGNVLAARQMTAEELAERIRERFDLDVDAAMVDQLARQDALQHANVELAVAAAQILGVSLDALFRTPETPSQTETSPIYFKGYSLEEITALLDDQTYGDLLPDSQEHLDEIVAEYGRTIYDRHLREYAAEQRISVEQARNFVTKDLSAALRWQAEFEADTQRQNAVIERARKRSG